MPKRRREASRSGVGSFLPLRKVMRQWADRKKMIEQPLFPGYLFVYVNERERIQALESQGAVKYVEFGGELAVVSETTIESLKIAARKPEDVRAEESALKLGDPIVVSHGPLAGMRGRLMEFRGATRIAIEIEAIRQVVSVEVPLSEVRPIEG